MRPPPWLPRALQRLLLLTLLLTAASCRRVSQPGSAATSGAAAGGCVTVGGRLVLADTALPPAEADQVHWPFHFTLTTSFALVLSVLVREGWQRLCCCEQPILGTHPAVHM